MDKLDSIKMKSTFSKGTREGTDELGGEWGGHLIHKSDKGL